MQRNALRTSNKCLIIFELLLDINLAKCQTRDQYQAFLSTSKTEQGSKPEREQTRNQQVVNAKIIFNNVQHGL